MSANIEVCVHFQSANEKGKSCGNVTTCGIDLAKNVFSPRAVDGQGAVALRKTVIRVRLAAVVAQLPPCVIGLEACSGAHEWARRFESLEIELSDARAAVWAWRFIVQAFARVSC